ncbi:MAG: hypothetical protein AB7R69_06445, partial [Candidatus Babeliales bacterium]
MIANKDSIQTEIALSPEGQIYLNNSTYARELLPLLEFEKISALFTKGPSAGLLLLGIQDFCLPLPPSFAFWQTFSRHFITYICKLARVENTQTFPNLLVPEDIELQEIIDQALGIKGIEYLNINILKKIWQDLIAFLKQDLQDFGGSLEDYLHRYNPRWNLVGRVCFHLAENKINEHRPFAFLATYTTQLSQQSGAQHLPLNH